MTPATSHQPATRHAILIAALALALTLGGGASAGARSLRVGRADARGGAIVRLGPAVLNAPAGALRAGQRVVVRETRAPFAAAGRVFSFDVGRHRLRKRVAITVPLAQPYRPGTHTVLMYRAGDGTWYAVGGRVTADGTRVTARVTHLSSWAGLTVETLLRAALDGFTPRAVMRDDDCSNADPTVQVSGTLGPLELCVHYAAPRTLETITVRNTGSQAVNLGDFSGGVSQSVPSRQGIGALNADQDNLVVQGRAIDINYDATKPVSTFSWRPNLFETVKNAVAPGFVGGLYGPVSAAIAAAFTNCQPSGAESSEDAAIDAVARCIVGARGTLTVGGVSFSGLKTLAVQALKVVIKAKFADVVRPQPGGTVTLTSAQRLPAAGPAPPETPPSSSGGSPSGGPPHQLPPTPQFYFHHVYGTCADGHCGLNVRSGPGYSNYAAIATKYDGDEVDVVCQALGENVGPSPATGNSSAVWDQIVGGGWVSDLYVDTPGAGGFSSPIPRC